MLPFQQGGGTGAITALEALQNLGGLPVIEAYSADWDMDNLINTGEIALYKTNGDTLGTPYNKGIVDSHSAMIINYPSGSANTSVSRYASQVAICKSEHIYVRTYSGTTLSEWKQLEYASERTYYKSSNMTLGIRSDGYFTLYKKGNIVQFNSFLLCGNQTGYTLANAIPSGYRPLGVIKVPIALMANSTYINGGHAIIHTDGTIIFGTSVSTEAEIMLNLCWLTN